MPYSELESSGQSCALVAQSQAFLPQLRRAQRQEILTYLLGSVLVLLLAVTIAIAYHYSRPRPQWVELGNVNRFTAAQPTLVSVRATELWVVNTGVGFTVFRAVSNDRMGCHILWEIPRQKFVDWCLGIQYTLDGVYAFEGPPPIRNLDRYPARVDANGNLTINMTDPIWGKPMEWIKEECIAQQKGPAWYLEDHWHWGCDIDRIFGR